MNPGSNRLCFGTFEVDLQTHEIWNDGRQLKLIGQPFEILAALITRPGELVTREELRSRLWPQDTFVDFDHGLNTAVKKLRDILSDSAEDPRYIQTLPRLGYRCIAPVQVCAPDGQLGAGAPVYRWWKLASLVAGLLVAASFGIYLVHTRTSAPGEVTSVPLTTYPGTELAPSLSPDGNEVAFEWFQSSAPEEADLYVKQVGQERALRLTNHKANFIEPAWSPDGKSIAFVMSNEDGVGVYLIPALGGLERRLADLGKIGYPFSRLSWSADSRWVAFAKPDPLKTKVVPTFRIHLQDVETGAERILPAASTECKMNLHPSFSFDGKYVASDCVLGGGVGNKIYTQNSQGEETKEVAFIKAPVSWLDGLAWSTDGRSILFGAEGKLWRVRATGGNPEELPFGGIMPTVARTAARLALAQGQVDRNLWSLTLASETSLAGSPKTFAPSTRLQWGPSFSPDGNRVVFESDRSGTLEIWLADRDGSNPAQLTFLRSNSGTPRWSPDGRNIAFDSRASGRAELYIVSVDGGNPRKLITGTYSASHPFWSQDGRWIYFTTEKPLAVWKLPSTGGPAIQLTMGGGYYPQESADGKLVFYVVGPPPVRLWSVLVNGGDERPVEGMPRLAFDANWAPARNGIYFIDGKPAHYALNYFEFSTAKVHRVAALPDREVEVGIAVSPNGHTLLYPGVQRSEADLVLVDGFR